MVGATSETMATERMGRLELWRAVKPICCFALVLTAMLAAGQAPVTGPALPPDTVAPPEPAPQSPDQAPARQNSETPAQAPAPGSATPQNPPPGAQPAAPAQLPTGTSLIAIVPLDAAIPGAAATVSGSMQALKGRAYLTGSGSVTAGPATAQVTLPYRGVLRVCPSTTVRLSVDSSAAASDVPGLLIGLDGGAIEASFAIARDSDVLLTPNFRILIGGPGSSEVKVRLGQGGDTCVDNSGANAPYVVVTSVFDSGLYRVQPGQRVMFEHGDLKTVVDDEKEPCGCPPPGEKANEFPLAKSAGLAPPSALPPTVTGTNQPSAGGSASTTMIYNAPGNGTPQLAPIPAPDAAPQTLAAGASRTAKPPPAKEKPGFFKRVGRFFRRIFGAE